MWQARVVRFRALVGLAVGAPTLVLACSADTFVSGGVDGGGEAGASDGAGAVNDGAALDVVDTDGGSETGPDGDGAPLPACAGSSHAVCADFEDGVFPPAGFVEAHSFGSAAADPLVGYLSQRSLLAASPAVDGGTPRYGILQHTDSTLHLKVNVSGWFRLEDPPQGDFDLMMVHFTDSGSLTIADIGFAIEGNILYLERSANGSVSYFRPLSFQPVQGKWFYLAMELDTTPGAGPSALITFDTTQQTITGIGPGVTGIAASAERYGLLFVSAAVPSISVHVDNLTADFP